MNIYMNRQIILLIVNIYLNNIMYGDKHFLVGFNNNYVHNTLILFPIYTENKVIDKL